MSRIGKKVIVIPKGVKIDVHPGAVEVQGPKGKLRQALPAGIGFNLEGDQLQAQTLREDPDLGKFHGLARSLEGMTERSPDGSETGGPAILAARPLPCYF